MRMVLAKVLMLFAVVAPALAQTPEEVAERFFDALKNEDYVFAAELFDPDALTGFREMLSFLSDLNEAEKEQINTGLFGPGATQESVAALSDTEYFSSFLRMAMSQMGSPDIFDTSNMGFLGYVSEEPDTAHVVARMSLNIEGTEFEKMTVVSCRRVGGQWKLLLSGEIKGVPNQIRSALGVN